MINRRLIACTPLAVAASILSGAGPACATDFPNHSIEVIVPLGAGGGTDART